MLKTRTTYNNPLLLNDLGCSSLEVSTPHLNGVVRFEDDTNRTSGKIDSEHAK